MFRFLILSLSLLYVVEALVSPFNSNVRKPNLKPAKVIAQEMIWEDLPVQPGHDHSEVAIEDDVSEHPLHPGLVHDHTVLIRPTRSLGKRKSRCFFGYNEPYYPEPMPFYPPYVAPPLFYY